MTIHLHSIEAFEDDPEYSGPEAFDTGEYFDLPFMRSSPAVVAWLVVIAAVVGVLIHLG